MKTKKMLPLLLMIFISSILIYGQNISYLDSAFISVDSSIRPEIAIYNNKAYVFYQNTATRTFDIKIFNTTIATEYYSRTIFSGSVLIGYPTDIRIYRDSNTVVIFFETAGPDSTILWGARYILDDSLTVENPPFLIAIAPTEANASEGDILLNDPSPLVTNNAIYVGCRLRDTYLMQDSSRIYFYKFDKSTFTLSNQFLLDLSNVDSVNGGVRVFSLLYNNNYIYLALTSTISNTGVTDYEASLSDIVLVKLDTNWNVISSQTIFSEANIKPFYVSGFQYENGYYFLTYLTGKLNKIYVRIALYDSFWNNLQTINVLSESVGQGYVILRPSICVNNDTLFSGNNYPVAGSSAFVKRYVFYSPLLSVGGDSENIHSLFVNPNPFHQTTSIRFKLPQSENVSLKILDVCGREVKKFSVAAIAGSNSLTLETSDLLSGIYFLKITSSDFVLSRKIIKQ